MSPPVLKLLWLASSGIFFFIFVIKEPIFRFSVVNTCLEQRNTLEILSDVVNWFFSLKFRQIASLHLLFQPASTFCWEGSKLLILTLSTISWLTCLLIFPCNDHIVLKWFVHRCLWHQDVNANNRCGSRTSLYTERQLFPAIWRDLFLFPVWDPMLSIVHLTISLLDARPRGSSSKMYRRHENNSSLQKGCRISKG